MPSGIMPLVCCALLHHQLRELNRFSCAATVARCDDDGEGRRRLASLLHAPTQKRGLPRCQLLPVQTRKAAPGVGRAAAPVPALRPSPRRQLSSLPLRHPIQARRCRRSQRLPRAVPLPAGAGTLGQLVSRMKSVHMDDARELAPLLLHPG